MAAANGVRQVQPFAGADTSAKWWKETGMRSARVRDRQGHATRFRGSRGWQLTAAVAACVVAGALGPAPASAAAATGDGWSSRGLGATTQIDRRHGPVAGDDASHHVKVVAQALPNSCFTGIGRQPLPIVNGKCPNGGIPRTQQDYSWGFGTDDAQRNLWFGTFSNGLCDNLTSYFAYFQVAGLNPPPAFSTDKVSCEFDKSWAAQQNPALGVSGDVVPPYVYQYDTRTGKLTDRTPYSDPEVEQLQGFRAVGGLNNVMFMGALETSAGTAGGQGGPVHLLAFRQSDGAYLGQTTLSDYTNIKVIRSFGGHLYLGMGRGAAAPPGSSDNPTWGNLLKWTGSVNDPFHFQVVAALGSQPAYLDEFEGRLVAGTWTAGPPDVTAPNLGQEAPGIYVSPVLKSRPGGLTAADANGWTRSFTMDQFFPDPITAVASASMCGTVNLGGWEYFGTCNFPGSSTFFHIAHFPDQRPADFVQFEVLSQRLEFGGHLFRARNLGKPNQRVELLYGQRDYWVQKPDGSMTQQSNLLHQNPKYGATGFGIPNNYYIGWGMVKFRNAIYMGGVDLNLPIRDVVLNPATKFVSTVFGENVPDALLRAQQSLLPPPSQDGGPLWYIDNPNKPAKPLTNTGFNNAYNWGLRDMFPIGDKVMYIGTQGGMNYPAAGGSDPSRRPGWQLLKYEP